MKEGEKELSLEKKLNQSTQTFRKIFLLRFAESVIKHTEIEEFFALEGVMKKTPSIKKPIEIKELEQSNEELIPSIMYGERKRLFNPLPSPSGIGRPPPTLRIPETPLPPRLQYIKPSPTSINLDLGRLGTLMQNPTITSIECNGPEEHIILRGQKGMQTSNIILDEQEINQILENFSKATKIPLHEGVMKIAAGNLILSAIVSDVIGSKFIIKKMIQSPQRRY